MATFTRSQSQPNPIWMTIGTIVFAALLAIVFFAVASREKRHELKDEAPPAQQAPAPAPVVPH
jgi:hypothetical protein